ncbi:MAG: four helix bundle protein [Desulfobulbaceae bacterium]|nr:four helix bundle protein [Desulfobulbaceae bacterium]
MAKIKTFEELTSWQEARKLVNRIDKITQQGSFSKDFELRNQIRRSAISIMANIAEGFHRNSNKDFMRFLDYSRSSLAETISHCYIALDQEYISRTEFEEIKKQANFVWKKINKFISYLHNFNQLN